MSDNCKWADMHAVVEDGRVWIYSSIALWVIKWPHDGYCTDCLNMKFDYDFGWFTADLTEGRQL